jgi:hypothetical protein
VVVGATRNSSYIDTSCITNGTHVTMERVVSIRNSSYINKTLYYKQHLCGDGAIEMVVMGGGGQCATLPILTNLILQIPLMYLLI